MKKQYLILSLITIVSVIGIYLGFNKSYSASSETLDIKRKVLVETMDAFYRKGREIQYDTYRKNYYLNPEMITSDNPSFSVCSSFVQSVYKNAFDINVLSVTEYMGRYAYFNSKNENYEYVPFSYYKNHGYYLNGKNINKELDYSKFEKTLVNLVLPGDIFLTNNDSPVSGGHTMLVYSVDKSNNKITLIHSSGKNKETTDNLKKEFDSNGRTSFFQSIKIIVYF